VRTRREHVLVRLSAARFKACADRGSDPVEPAHGGNAGDDLATLVALYFEAPRNYVENVCFNRSDHTTHRSREDVVMTRSQQALIDKIATLPPQRLAEVEDFVDFLRTREAGQDTERDSRLAAQAARGSEPAFARVWDNDEDAAYDRL
jgi:hypothetical protein